MASKPEARPRRLFFALWPPASVAQRLQRLQEGRLAAVPGRRLPADRLHLTLRFVGNADAETTECLRRAAARVRVPPFAIRLERLGAFPRPQVVWAAPAQSPPELAALAAALERVCQACGLPAETRDFAPHLTLLRKARRHLPRDETIEPIDWPVTEFVLAASETLPEGPVYTVLERWPLQAASEA